MSFAKIFLGQPAIQRLAYSIDLTRSVGGSFESLRPNWTLFDADMQSYVFIGVHSFTVIGDYVFLYEDGTLQHCFNIRDDSTELFKAFRLMCDHSSVNLEESIDLYEGLTVTSHYAARCAVPRTCVAMAAE